MPLISECIEEVTVVLTQQGWSALLGFLGWSVTFVVAMVLIYWVVTFVFGNS